MRRQLILSAALIASFSQIARAHALFPGQQVIYTMGERGIAYFQTTNERKDVLEYRVELFEYDNWSATRHAVASPERMTVPAGPSATDRSSIRRFTVMIDLDGRQERTIRVCTKSVAGGNPLRPASTSVNTRVCSKLTVRRLQ